MDLCPLCVQFTGEALNTLLNLILNGGVVGGCGTLCQALATKTGNQILGEVCNVLCDIVGVEEFVKLIEKADLDQIKHLPGLLQIASLSICFLDISLHLVAKLL